jgi:hydrogenase nickel incorporation protein HypB
MGERRFNPPGPDGAAATANRSTLRAAGVFAANVIGGAGCGKTTLIKGTIERLLPERRVGVITADPMAYHDAGRLAGCAERVVPVETGPDGGVLRPALVHDALGRFELRHLHLLLIENISSLTGPERFDLGQDAVVGVFSVAAGDDKAAKYPGVIRLADVVLLNKADLLGTVPFDRAAFRRDVAALHPSVPIIELSALNGHGMEEWMAWLRDRERWAAAVAGHA